jgi:hypothetical protein
MKNLMLFFLLLLLNTSLQGQTSEDLIQKLKDIQTNLKEVSTGKDTYVQELNYKEDAPYRLIFILRTTDKKGKTSVDEYLFNLGLFDENLVRWSSSRNEMRLNLKAGNQEVAEYLKDGEMKGYENEVVFYCPDVDNARALEQLFKEAIPIAESLWKEAINLPKDLDELLEWTGQRIGAVSVDDKTYQQSWSADASSQHRVIFTLEEDNEPAKSFHFSLSDVLKESVQSKIKGNEVLLEIGTSQKKAFIRIEENGLLSDYDNQFIIRSKSPDEAQEIIFALKEMLPLARSQAEEEYTVNFSGIEEGLQAVQSTVTTFNDGTTLFEPSIQADCQTEFQLKTTFDSKSEENSYLFHFFDLDPQSLDIEVKRAEISVFMRADNRVNLLQHFKGDEQQNYANTLNIPVENIPSAKLLMAQLKYVMENCTDNIEVKDLDWLAQTLGGTDMPELTQQLEKQEADEACKLAFTATQDNGKKVKSEKYEFNLYDLDADDLALQVKGKQVLVNLETRSKEKIINNYTDGEKLSYVNNFDMQFKDIPTAKNVVYTLKEMIRACQE